MSYAIIRHNKLRSYAAIAAVGMHNGRLKQEGNVDAERSHMNRHIDGHGNSLEPGNGWLNKPIRDRLKKLDVKVRSNAVLAIEVLMTTSPEWWEEFPEGSPERKARGLAWMNEQIAYVKERFGPDNVVAMSLHVDEKTPHLHAVVMPLVQKVDGRSKSKEPKWKLDAFSAMGGGPKGVSEIVQRYGERMKEKFGLEPGEPAAVRRGRGENVEHVPIGVHQRMLAEEREKTAAATRKMEEEAEKAEAARLKIEELKLLTDDLKLQAEERKDQARKDGETASRIREEAIALKIERRKEHEALMAKTQQELDAAAKARAEAEAQQTAAVTARQTAEAEGRKAGETEGRTAGRKAIEAELAATREATNEDRRKAAAELKAAEEARRNAAAQARQAVEAELQGAREETRTNREKAAKEREEAEADRRAAAKDASEAARDRQAAQADRKAAETARSDAEALKSSWETKNRDGAAAIARMKEELEGREKFLDSCFEALEADAKALEADRQKLEDEKRSHSRAVTTDREKLEADRKALETDRKALEVREAKTTAFETGIEAWVGRKIVGVPYSGEKEMKWAAGLEEAERQSIEARMKPAFDAVWSLVDRAMKWLSSKHAERELELVQRERKAAENLKALNEATKATFSSEVVQQIEAAPGASMSEEEMEMLAARAAAAKGKSR